MLLVVKAVAFSQTEKIKIIDKIYSKSIIELTYVNHVPNGEYMRWNLDGTLKEKGVIDNSKINTDKIDMKFATNKTSVDSFYKAQNSKNYLEKKPGVFSTITGNDHKFVNLVNFTDSLNKVVYDYYNSYKAWREKYSLKNGKPIITMKEYFKVVKNEQSLLVPKIDSLFEYSENGKLTSAVKVELLSDFKSSKVWSESYLKYDQEGHIVVQDINYYETKNDFLKDLSIMKNVSFSNGKKVISYYVIDSWNNKIKI